jgi:hypothetical protein
MTFELIDLESLGDNALKEFSLTIEASGPEKRAAFEKATDRLLAKVEFAYAVAAKLAQREPTLEGTEAIWAKTVAICDQIAQQLQEMEHSDLVKKASYDRLLDYRNAAETRRHLHS